MIACHGGDRFWPLTSDVAVFDAPLDRTVGRRGPDRGAAPAEPTPPPG